MGKTINDYLVYPGCPDMFPKFAEVPKYRKIIKPLGKLRILILQYRSPKKYWGKWKELRKKTKKDFEGYVKSSDYIIDWLWCCDITSEEKKAAVYELCERLKKEDEKNLAHKN